MRRRQELALEFEKFLDDSGIKVGFQVIFAEILEKRVPPDQMFPYAIARLRSFSKEMKKINEISK